MAGPEQNPSAEPDKRLGFAKRWQELSLFKKAWAISAGLETFVAGNEVVDRLIHHPDMYDANVRTGLFTANFLGMSGWAAWKRYQEKQALKPPKRNFSSDVYFSSQQRYITPEGEFIGGPLPVRVKGRFGFDLGVGNIIGELVKDDNRVPIISIDDSKAEGGKIEFKFYELRECKPLLVCEAHELLSPNETFDSAVDYAAYLHNQQLSLRNDT